MSLFLGLDAPGAAQQTEIGNASLQVAGTRLVVSPASQTVPFDTPTIVLTSLEGYDPELGVLPGSLRVRGDLVGPEVNGLLAVEAVPGEPLRIPRLRVEGEYRLENIRLVLDETVLAYGEPRDATINVAQILISRVSSRALTLDEIRARGLVIDENSFEAINLTFAYGVAGNSFVFDMPLVYDTLGPSVRLLPNPDMVRLPSFDDSQKTVKPRFEVPKVVPFLLEVEKPPPVKIPSGGCDPRTECRPELSVVKPMVGVILFPTELSLLHQFFSVVLQVENGAPEGDPAVLRDLFATVKLPPGLRLGETEPPTLLGRPIPIKDPGSDGIRGTADDKNFLVAHAGGDVEVLLEGVKHGTHIVEFDINGVLEGLPTGPQPINGKARGAVAVRDPRLAAHIAHPQVVRANVEYSMFVTLSNIGNAPINLVDLSLPPHGLSGVTLVDGNSRQIETLNPGQSETVEFRVEAQRTGKVVSSSMKVGSSVSPSFEWSVAVGDDGSLSPDTLVLPTTAGALPKELTEEALALLGIGYSLAKAPPSFGSGLPRVGEEAIAERTYRFGQLGRHLDYGEPTLDVVSTLVLDWLGARDGDWDWDQLRRESANGGKLAVAIADLLDAEASSSHHAFERLAAVAHYLSPQAAFLDSPGLELEVSSRTTGKAIAGAGDDDARLRELPFAELYDLADGDMVVLARNEDGGFTATVRAPQGGGGSGGSGDLHLLVPDAQGLPRDVRFGGLSLQAGGSARVHFGAGQALFVLEVDSDGDGVFESSRSPFTTAIAPRPFQVLAAVQNTQVDEGGHVVDVLFSEEVDLRSMVPRSGDRFVLPDNRSNGGLVKTEEDLVLGMLMGGEVIENPFEGLNNPRIVRVIFDNPPSPFVDNVLTVSQLDSVDGDALGSQEVLVETRVDVPAIQLEGVIYGPDGLPMPGADVVLYERDLSGVEGRGLHCKEHATAVTTADENGRYHFGFVRHGDCGPKFRVRAQDPANGHFGNVRGKVRFAGQTQTLDLVMPGRGRVIGRVTYEDGSIPDDLRVIVYNPQFQAGRRAHVGEDGYYDVDHMVVGTLTLAADDGQGNFAYGTFELPERGATAEKNLVIIRNDPTVDPPGSVRGTVKTVDGDPVHEAFVALYVDEQRTAVIRTDIDGAFDFGTVPSGIAEIEVFTESSTYPGIGAAAQVFFEIDPDQVETVDILVRDDRGTVQGHVYRKALGGATTPVEGAVVWAAGTDYHAITDANGVFVLEDVFAGSWRLQAVLPETDNASVTLTTAGGVVDQDLYFEAVLPDGGLVGKVLDYTGQPVAGASVRLAGGHYSVRWHHSATTGSDGRFVIEGLEPGRYGVHAFAGNDGGVGWATIRFPGETEQMTVIFRQGTIRGQTRAPVGEDGSLVGVVSQIAYRKVEVYTPWDLVVVPPSYTYIETDPNGHFEIPALAGPYELHVFNAFHGDLKAKGQIDYHGQEVEHDFRFEVNGDIRGTVYDHDGETPVAGAQVSLYGGSFDGYDVFTDENGEYHFPLIPPGSYKVRALDNEGVVFRKTRINIRMRRFGQQLNDIDLTLPVQGTISGWVEDADGNSVPGAVVSMQENYYPWRRLVQNADEDGNYSFENVFGGGRVTVYAKAPSLGGLRGRSAAEIFSEAEDVTTPITLEGTGEVEGTVTTPVDGSVVHLASVRLYRGSGFEDGTTSDEDGRFYFDKLKMGWYQVSVYDKGTGRRGRSKWVELEQHDQVVVANVELESRGDVVGRFVDGDTGSPLPGHAIRLQTERALNYYVTTDIDGYFDFEGLPEGDLWLRASDSAKRRWVQRQGTLRYEDQVLTLDLTLVPLSDVTGRVWNPPGMPVALADNVNVRISQGGDIIGAGFDNPFAFRDIVPKKSFTLIAKQQGTLRQVKHSSRINTVGQDRDYDLTLQALGSVSVRVEDSFGNPVSGASVHVRNRHDYGSHTFDASTGADNEVRFGDIREGRVYVTARNPVNGLKGSESGTLSLDGELLEIDVVLQNTGFVRGRALRPDGINPAIGALVALKRGSKWFLSETDDQGYFDYEHVTMGSYTLVIQEADGGLGTIERFGSLSSNGEIDDFGTLVLDDADPYVVSIEPGVGTRDLPLETQVVITFSEPMDVSRQGSAIKLRKISGTNVGFASSWSADNTQLTMIPNGGLASGTGYDVFVGQNIYDEAGRSLEWRVRSHFYTADVIPPAVIRILPRDNAVQVPVDSDLRITFSEPVDLQSLSGSSIQLTDLTVGQGLSSTFQLRPGEREVIVTPVLPFETDRDIQLTVQTVADLAGNVMPTPVSIVFWTPDVTLPVSTWTSPNEGEAFTAGDDIPFAATVTDNRGVATVRFEVGEWSSPELTSPPFGWTAPAPVADETDPAVTLTVEATDIFGNVSRTDRSIDVLPLDNAVPPTVALACPVTGDFVAPGVELEVSFSVADDLAVESAWLTIDGETVDRLTPINAAEADVVLRWTPPADATPGQLFAATVEVRDFAGNVTSEPFQLQATDGPTLAGDQAFTDATALFLADGRFDLASDLALPAGLTLLQGAELDADAGTLLSLADLRVQCGAWARLATLDASGTVTVESGAELKPIRLETLDLRADQLVIEAGASIAGRGLGYYGEEEGTPQGPPGIARPQFAGGGHGGPGHADVDRVGGDAYDSVYLPRQGGMGGAESIDTFELQGTSGGGVVTITANSVQLDGTIDVRGQYSGQSGGRVSSPGAGGTVRIHASSLLGAGQVLASGGGAPHCSYVGVGGGGRVALWVDDLTAFDVATQVENRGGRADCLELTKVGAAGTTLVHTTGSTYGDLVLANRHPDDQEEQASTAVFLPALGSGAVLGTEVAGADLWLSVDADTKPRFRGAWLELFDASGASLGEVRVIEVDAAGDRLRAEGASALVGLDTWRGVYRFDSIVLDNARIDAADPLGVTDMELSGQTLLDGEIDVATLDLAPGTHLVVRSPIRAGQMTIGAGSTVVPANGLELDIEVDGLLTIGVDALVDVSEQGYGGGDGGSGERGYAPAGVQGSMEGGVHGGQGAPGSDLGETFDSVYQPHLGGGGGGSVDSNIISRRKGGPGGGVLKISAGELVLDGTLRSNGGRGGNNNGLYKLRGGAGGTIHVSAGRLAGSGTIEAEGARGDDSGGGGGRVALWLGWLDGFDPELQVSAQGGRKSDYSAFGGPGTIFVHEADLGSVWGRLVIGNGHLDDGTIRLGRRTELPVLGSGTVVDSTVAPDGGGTDLLITTDANVLGRWLGVPVVLLDGVGNELAELTVTEILGNQLRLQGGAAWAGQVVSYRGLYRFDDVVLLDAARLRSEDEVRATRTVIDGLVDIDSTVVSDEILVRAGSVVSSVSNADTLRIAAADRITVESGAIVDLRGLGYGPTNGGEHRGAAPPNVLGAKNGGSHGGQGRPESGGTNPGEIYGSVYWPSWPGGGGGTYVQALRSDRTGGYGGGVIELLADEVVIDGEINADGTNPPVIYYDDYYNRGGAGGTVRVVADVLSGTGSISARGEGGDYSGGGGGRVALEVGTLSGFDPDTQVSVRGGLDQSSSGGATGIGGAGTLYLRTNTSTFGDLVIDGENPFSLPMGLTPLPAVGEGVVGTVTPDGDQPAHAWIEAADAGQVFDLGVAGTWLRIAGTDYRILGEAGDRRTVLVENASGAILAGETYEGIYKFDTITVRGEGRLRITDSIDYSVLQDLAVEPGSEADLRDQQPPTIDTPQPADGATVHAGDLLTLSANITDNASVASVRFVFDAVGEAGQVLDLVDTEAPYEAQLRVPHVEVSTPMGWTLEAVDPTGNLAQAQYGFVVEPGLDALAPTVTLDGCPMDGDGIEPGSVLELAFGGTDEARIESVSLWVDGAEVDSLYVDAESWNGSLSWTVPNELGRAFTVEARVRDFGGNLATASLVLSTPSLAVLGGDQALGAASVDGQPLFLGAGRFLASETLRPSSLVLLSGASLGAPSGQWLDLEIVDTSGAEPVPGAVRVQCAAAIDLDGTGHAGGWDAVAGGSPAGVSGALENAGGSHGGDGWPGDLGGTPGAAYGSVYFPSLAGAGGAGADAARPGAAGGGALLLVAGSIVNDGAILARGETADAIADASRQSAGAGAGGSIWIEAASLAGSGTIDASGGRYISNGGLEGGSLEGGSGAGGRIALYVDDLSAFDNARILAQGGWIQGPSGVENPSGAERLAGAGTVLLHDAASVHGRLLLSQALDVAGTVGATVLTPIGTGTISAVETVDGTSDLRITAAGAFAPGVEGAWLRIAGADYRIVDREDASHLRLADADGLVSAGETYEGVYKFDAVLSDGRARFEPADALEVGSPPLVSAPVASGDGLEGSTQGLSATFTADGPAPYTVVVRWGDGSESSVNAVDQGSHHQVDASHAYADQGSYTASVCVTDGDGAQGCAAVAVTIANVAPAIEWVGIPSTVELDAGQALDLHWRFLDPGPADVHTATVDWGDGNQADLGSVSPLVFQQQSHVYGAAGSFALALCVDDGAASTCEGITVNVSEAGGPTVTIDSLTAGAAQGEQVDLTASFLTSDPGPYTATVDWGDGTTLETIGTTTVAGGGTLAGSHVYADDGDFTVRVCVVDGQGSGCSQQVVTIANSGPSAEAFAAFDYDDWYRVELPHGDLGYSSWTVTDTGSGMEVKQTANGRPAFFVGDVPTAGARIRGTLQNFDNDRVGFVLGYDPGEVTAVDSEYLVLAWHLQVFGSAQPGLRLVRVHGRRPDLQYLVDDASTTVIATGATLGSSGYVQGTAHEVVIETVEDGLRIYVDGSLEFDLGPETDLPAGALDALASGSFGFYAYAQEDVRFTGFAMEAVLAREGQAAHLRLPVQDAGLGDEHTGEVAWGDGTTTDLDFETVDGRVWAFASHVYEEQGAYTARATIRDDSTAETLVDVPVEIWNATPTVAHDLPLEADGALSVAGTLSYADGGSLDTHTASVDWGDGTTEQFTPTSTSGAGSVALAHTYGVPGTFTVELCATDDELVEGCETHTVTVVGGGLALGAPSVSAIEGAITEGGTVELNLAITGAVGATTAVVDWGDGERQALDLGTDATGLLAQHVYADDGSHGIELCVGAPGQGACVGTTVSVADVAPTLRGLVGPFDYEDWTFMDTPDNTQSASAWTLIPGGVEHRTGSKPTFFVGDVPSENVRIRGQLRSIVDDDWIGLVFGFDADEQTLRDPDFMVLGWKKDTQSGVSRGLRLVRFTGPVGGGLWSMDASTHRQVLASAATLGNTGYVDGQAHEILYENVDGQFRLWVDGVLQFDLQGDFPAGRFGFFTNAHDGAQFTDFEVEALLAVEGRPTVVETPFVDAGVLDTHTAAGSGTSWVELRTEDPHTGEPAGGGAVIQSLATPVVGISSIQTCVQGSPAGQHCIQQPLTVLPFGGSSAPVVEAPSLDAAPTEGVPVTLTTTFSSADGERSFEGEVDWGDGTVTPATLGGLLPALSLDASHTYADDGVYAVTVRVEDDLGQVGTNTLIAMVANTLPTVALETTPAAVEVWVGYTLDVDFSFTDPGPVDVHTASVEWGDGNVDEQGIVLPSQVYLASHVFDAAGTYTVEICVRDDDGEGCAQLTATATEVPAPEVTIDSLTAGTVQGGAVQGEQVDLAASFTAVEGSPFTATVDWGDGTAPEAVTVTEISGGGTLGASRIFADDGTYTVEVCVADVDTDTGCAQQTLVVANVAPTLLAIGPYDFSDWHRADVNGGSQGVSKWNLLSATEVQQQNKNQPSVFVGDAWSTGMRIRGRIWTVGNDWIGLALGYDEGEVAQPETDYLLLGWKDVTESGASLGMRLGRVKGAFGAGFWPFQSNDFLDILANAATFGNSGYATQVEYEFLVESLPDQLRIWVDGNLEFDIDEGLDGLQTGVMAFYAYSQDDTRFRGFEAETVLGREGQPTRVRINVDDPGVLDTFGGTLDWGDGTSSPLTVHRVEGHLVAEAEHVYDADGTYAAQACLADDALAALGQEVCHSIPVEIWNADPAVEIDLPMTVASGTALAGSLSYTDVDTETHSASVDWGDGSSEVPTLSSTGGSGTAGLSHTWTTPGAYTVQVCVTDSDSAQGCAEHTVIVTGGGLGLSGGAATDVDEGSVVDLLASFTGAVGDVTGWVDWGDGEPELFALGSSATELSAQHTYGDDGVRTIEVCVATVGQGDCTTTTTTLANVAPTLASHLGPFDYSDWMPMHHAEGSNLVGTWSTITNGMRINNSRPTFYVGDVPSDDVRISGKIRMYGDDDWVGLTFGFDLGEQASGKTMDFLVMGWKRTTQSPATKGLRLVRYRGGPFGGGLWAFDDGPNRELVATALTRANAGYATHTTYTFVYEKVGQKLRIWVNGTLEFDLEGDFPSGNIGFFSNAHDQADFTEWQVEALLAEEGQPASVKTTFTDPGFDDTHTANGTVSELWSLGRVDSPVTYPTAGAWTATICVDDGDTGGQTCLDQTVTVLAPDP